jgi:hypothetical protein
MRSVIQANNCHGYAVNETQKPEAIVERLAQGDLLSANAALTGAHDEPKENRDV